MNTGTLPLSILAIILTVGVSHSPTSNEIVSAYAHPHTTKYLLMVSSMLFVREHETKKHAPLALASDTNLTTH